MSQQVSQEVPFLISSPTNILTIQDVVLDSPVWRANVLHLEDQIDQFEKWIDGFIRALKSYIEAITKYNTQATVLCKRTFFNGLDGTLIDTKIAGNVVTKFATTLQSMVAYRMKTVSDLEDQLLNPLQKMVKTDFKSFKDSRKQYDRMLDKYETQLYRYNMLSKQKEASALREDAFQMYEFRKSYVKNSSDYFSKLVSFKANLEHMLVECFSSALLTHIEEIDESAYACTSAKESLPGWRQWLGESKLTCDYQVQKMKRRCNELQDAYIEQAKPNRSLKRYSSQSNDKMSAVSSTNDLESDEDTQAKKNDKLPASSLDSNTISIMKNAPTITINRKSGNKQGYLNCRIVPAGKPARPPWTRKWVFLQEGWLGTCTVSTVNKEKGCIILGDRVSITECVFRVCTDIDRRYCFEVVHPKCQYYLQAENEEDMQRWLWAIEYNMEKHELQKPSPSPFPQALLSPKATMRSSVNGSNLKLSLSSSSSSNRLVVMSTSPLPSPGESPIDRSLTPIVSTTTSSLTALMIREGENNHNHNNDIPQVSSSSTHQEGNASSISQQLSSWGMPWLSNGISALSNNSEEDISSTSSPNLRASNSSSSTTKDSTNQQQLVVWPTKLERDVPTPGLLHYSSELEASQRELRKFFANVPEDEVVLESFLASLYRKPTTASSEEDNSIDNRSTSYGYSGHIYVTQKSLWFYSCTLMTCVNMIVVPLEKIKSIRSENTEYSNNSMVMMIDVEESSTSSSAATKTDPFCFGLWLESPDVISERLKVIVGSAKRHKNENATTDIQAIYDTIRNITHAKLNKNKTPTSHVTTSSALYASVTPINVQAHYQQPMQKTSSSSTTGTADEKLKDGNSSNHEDESNNESTQPHHGSPAQGALTAVYNAAQQKNKNISTLKQAASHTPSSSIDEKQPSSFSETTKEKWPSHIPKPKKEVKCDCNDHLEKTESNIILPVSAKQLYDLMFSNTAIKSKDSVWSKLNKAKNYGEPTLTDWSNSDSEGVIMERTMTYIMPVTTPMVKAKETDVIETQQILQQNDHLSYVVMVMTKTPNLPYADAFIPCIKYCITFVSPTSCRLVCSMGVTWLRSIFVKGMVNKAATKGMQETINELMPVIKHEIASKFNNNNSNHGDGQKPPIKKDDKLPEIPTTSTDKLSKKRAEDSLAGGRSKYNLFTSIISFIVMIYMVYQFYLSRKYENRMKLYHPHHNTTMIWRGVYLRDIQNEVTEREAQLNQVNYNVYRLFQNARVNGTTQQWKYPWFSKQHRSMAEELGYSRERLGAIRYELLSTFRILNRVEYQLLENEYWNWLADQKLQCRKKNKKLSKELCQAFEKEIEACDV